MLTTNDKIIKASLKVFSEKGYLAATTLEISKVAGVSEMTLFRHFKTKENLFLTTVRQSIVKSINSNYEIDFELSLEAFVTRLLHEKLLLISKNIEMIKMLIRESLSGILTEELNFPIIINKEVSKIFEEYISHNKINKDATIITETLVGILLRYAVMNGNHKYHLLNKKEQESFLLRYTSVLKI